MVRLLFGMCLVLAVVALRPDRSRGSLVVDIPAAQVGGFYAGGATPDNSVTKQNYFVGYGTSPGFARTPERRSFFVFPLISVGGPIESATLKLHLVVPGGLIFGKGPGDPAMGPLPSDVSETFQLTLTPFPSAMVTSPSLSPGVITTIFSSMDDIPVASPLTFGPGSPVPMEPSPGVPAEISIVFDGAGLASLNTALLFGEVVLSGWMPTWTFDSREFPPMSGMLVEGSELMFGFTDVHDGFPTPTLSVTYSAIPEASGALMLSWVLVAAGCIGVVRCGVRRLRRRT